MFVSDYSWNMELFNTYFQESIAYSQFNIHCA